MNVRPLDQERIAEDPPQPGQRRAHGRLADPQPGGRLGHVALDDQRIERDQQIQVHLVTFHISMLVIVNIANLTLVDVGPRPSVDEVRTARGDHHVQFIDTRNQTHCGGRRDGSQPLRWSLIARYAIGLRLYTPGFTPSQQPADLNIGIVLAASAVGSALGIGALALIQRTARPRRTWVITAAIVLLASLSAPFAGHGITIGNELALVCMHLAVGAVLIPALAAGPRTRCPSCDTRWPLRPLGPDHPSS